MPDFATEYRQEQEVKAASEQVAAAWLDKGPEPGYHYQAMGKLHTEWPVLAQAVERLARAVGPARK